MAAVAGALVGTLTGFTLNRLFPSGGANINVVFDQARLEAVLQRLGTDFAQAVDHSVRENLLQQSFSEIKVKTNTAWRLFTDHCASVTPQQPRGDETGLSNAFTLTEQAYAAFRDHVERDLYPTCISLRSSHAFKRLSHCPPTRDYGVTNYTSGDERVSERDLLEKQHKDLYRHLEKAKVYMLACKTIVSLNLLIIARRSDLFPGIRRITPDVLEGYRNLSLGLQKHYKKLQEFRALPAFGGFHPVNLGNESGSACYSVSILKLPEWHKKKNAFFHTTTGIDPHSKEHVYEITPLTVRYSFQGNQCVLKCNFYGETLTSSYKILERVPNMKEVACFYLFGMQVIVAEKLEQRTHVYAESEEIYREMAHLAQMIQQIGQQNTELLRQEQEARS